MWTYFNPLPPHGGRHNKLVVAVVGQGFQSTPSAWRETVSSYRITQSPVPFQSTPSAWRETAFTALVSSYRGISIHSLRMEGDAADRPKRSAVKVFQSTPSAWRETYCLQWWQFRKTHHFNPLPPHGGRPTHSESFCIAGFTFQSTPSAWRETQRVCIAPV